jgi:hypothetical protein
LIDHGRDNEEDSQSKGWNPGTKPSRLGQREPNPPNEYGQSASHPPNEYNKGGTFITSHNCNDYRRQ